MNLESDDIITTASIKQEHDNILYKFMDSLKTAEHQVQKGINQYLMKKNVYA